MRISSKYSFKALLVVSCILANVAHAQLPFAANGKTIKINNKTIYYEETGQGTPLLLMHGFGRTAEDWNPYISSLSKKHRVIAIDLPGHGRSSLLDSSSNYLHKQAAMLILSFLDSLKIKELNVMGFSSGAINTLYLGTLRPGLVKKMVVAAGHLYFSDVTRKFINSLGGPVNFINNEKELTPLHGLYKGKLIGEQFWNFRKLYGDPSFTPDVLASIKAKALIIHGDDDPAAHVENAFTMYKHIPGAHLWIIPYAEHVGIFAPDNTAEFLKRVNDFLER